MLRRETYFIKTFGCQMNEADSSRMSALLQEKGLARAGRVQDADFVLINGCSVREKAVHKAVSTLGELKKLPRKPLIGMGGCVGQLDQGKLFRRAPHLDFVFGTDAIDSLPEILHRVEQGERKLVYADFDRSENYSTSTKVDVASAQAFVNIMKGCDKFCTYCIVPFTRGREKSRSIDEVLADVARLVAAGVREVTLLGQNVNSFGKGNPNTRGREPRELRSPIGKVGPDAGEENFPQLLRAMEEDPRLRALSRIRFTSSHPLDFSDELVDCFAKAGKLCPHLHLPVQSGSNEILKTMGRHHRIETYIEQMERLRRIRPGVALSTDLIVGFPGETEEDFQATLSLLDRIEYDNVFAFAYSPRPGTRATKLADDVPATEKNRRLNELLKHQTRISGTRNERMLGQSYEILVEGPAKNQVLAQEGLTVWTGRTPCSRVVNFLAPPGRPLRGRFVDARITAATGLSLTGELLSGPGCTTH